MSRPGVPHLLRKTSNSELGGIHFAHFPGEDILKNPSMFPSLAAQPGNLLANDTFR